MYEKAHAFKTCLGQIIVARKYRAAIIMDYVFVNNKLALLVIRDVFTTKCALMKSESEDDLASNIGSLTWRLKL